MLATPQCFDARVLFGIRYRAVDERCRQSACTERVYLILHERDQRRHYQRDAVENHRGQLVAQRLATAGRHHDDGIFAFQDRADYFALAFAEILAAEVFLKRSNCIRERVHASESITRISRTSANT